MWPCRPDCSGGRRRRWASIDALRGDGGCWQEGEGTEVGEREREISFTSITLSTQQGSSTLCPYWLYPQSWREVGEGQAWNLHLGLPASWVCLSIICWRVKQSSRKDTSGGRDWICVQPEKESEEKKGWQTRMERTIWRRWSPGEAEVEGGGECHQ